MPAGILSDMIQQYKAIFEGEPIELSEEEARRQATTEAQPETSIPESDNPQHRDSERQQRGNRNSMIYATNSDVMLNSVGRELTGTILLYFFAHVSVLISLKLSSYHRNGRRGRIGWRRNRSF
jgi:hypothetical protein